MPRVSPTAEVTVPREGGVPREELQRWLATMPRLLKPLVDCMPKNAGEEQLEMFESALVTTLRNALQHLVDKESDVPYETRVTRDVFSVVVKGYVRKKPANETEPASSDRPTLRASKYRVPEEAEVDDVYACETITAPPTASFSDMPDVPELDEMGEMDEVDDIDVEVSDQVEEEVDAEAIQLAASEFLEVVEESGTYLLEGDFAKAVANLR